jgi:positive regulator of sigma E activity
MDDGGSAALVTEANFGFLGLIDLNKSPCDDCQAFAGCGSSCLPKQVTKNTCAPAAAVVEGLQRTCDYGILAHSFPETPQCKL